MVVISINEIELGLKSPTFTPLLVVTDKNERVEARDVATTILEYVKIVTVSVSETMLFYVGGVYCKGTERLINDATERMLEEKTTTEVIGHVQRMTYIDRDRILDGSEWVCLENGILNVHTGEFKDHTPEMIFTKKLPVKYHPTRDCPTIAKFLKDVVGDEHVQLLRSEVVGSKNEATEVGGWMKRRT